MAPNIPVAAPVFPATVPGVTMYSHIPWHMSMPLRKIFTAKSLKKRYAGTSAPARVVMEQTMPVAARVFPATRLAVMMYIRTRRTLDKILGRYSTGTSSLMILAGTFYPAKAATVRTMPVTGAWQRIASPAISRPMVRKLATSAMATAPILRRQQTCMATRP